MPANDGCFGFQRLTSLTEIAHTHPAFELCCIRDGKGELLVADRSVAIVGPALLLIGPAVRHAFALSDVEAIAVRFQLNCVAQSFLNQPPQRPLAQLLTDANDGVELPHAVVDTAWDRLTAMQPLPPTLQMLQTLELLDLLARSRR